MSRRYRRDKKQKKEEMKEKYVYGIQIRMGNEDDNPTFVFLVSPPQ